MNDAEIAAVLVGGTEVVKMFGLPARFAPGFAILLGALLGGVEAFIQGGGQTDVYGGVLRGVIIGTTTTGIYAVTDKMISKSTQNGYSGQETH